MTAVIMKAAVTWTFETLSGATAFACTAEAQVAVTEK